MGNKLEYKVELQKIAFQVLYWGILAGLIILLLSSGIVTPQTEVPVVIEHFVEEKMNLWVYLAEIVVLVLIAGIAAVFGTAQIVDLAREEITRVLYNIGTFMGWICVILYYLSKNNDLLTQGGFVFVGFCLIGLLIAVWLKPKNAAVNQPKCPCGHSEHDKQTT